MPETNALFAPLNWVWESPGIAIGGGDWHATLPLANLLSPEVPDYARSTSAARAATRFTMDFGASRRSDTAGIFFANLTKDALARIRLHDLALAALDADFRGGDLPAPFAFSRGSAARYIGSDRRIHLAGSDAPRFQRCADGQLGLLIEYGATNLCQRWDDLAHSFWTKTRTAVTTDGTAAPEVDVLADVVLETATSGSHTISAALADGTLTDAAPYTWSIYVQGGRGRDWARLRYSNGGTTHRANFNLTTGAVGAVSLFARGYIEALAGGWYRLILQFDAGSNAADHVFTLDFLTSNASSDSAPSYAGNAANGFAMYGSQIEAGTRPTSGIATTSASASRNRDVCKIDGAEFTAIWSATAGAAAAEVEYAVTPDAGTMLAFHDGTDDEVIYFHLDEGNDLSGIDIVTGGSSETSGTAFSGTFAAAAGTPFRVAAAWATDDVRGAVDGSLLSQDTNVDLPTVDRLELGYSPTMTAGDPVLIRRFAYWPERIADSRLTAGTAAWDGLDPAAHDTGWFDPYPVTHQPVAGFLPFGRPSADGKVPDDERDPRGISFTRLLDAAVDHSKMTVEFRDEANPDGFVELSIPFAGKAERCTVANGFSLEPVEESQARRLPSGTLVARQLWIRKRGTGAVDWEEQDAALATWFEMRMKVGVKIPVLFMLLPGEAGIHADRFTILGKLERPTPTEHREWKRWGWPFAIVAL